MNANNSGASESTSDTVSLPAKKKKKEKRREEKRRNKKNKKKKRKHRSSDCELENTRESKKLKKCKEKKSDQDLATGVADDEPVEMPGPSVPRALLAEQAKSRAPMTKEEWEKSQSVIRRVYDESTGRTRIIKGDGEILEEIVSKDRHREINKHATAGDGAYFQNKLQVDRK